MVFQKDTLWGPVQAWRCRLDSSFCNPGESQGGIDFGSRVGEKWTFENEVKMKVFWFLGLILACVSNVFKKKVLGKTATNLLLKWLCLSCLFKDIQGEISSR